MSQHRVHTTLSKGPNQLFQGRQSYITEEKCSASGGSLNNPLREERTMTRLH